MHSCELITNLCAKKVVCHRAEVAKNFRCCNHRLCVLHCDWYGENSLQKAIKVNEAQGTSRMSPDPLLSGWVWAQGYFPGASEDMYLFGNRMHGVFLKSVYYVLNINGYIRCLQRASTDLKPATQLHFLHEIAVPISRSSQHT